MAQRRVRRYVGTTIAAVLTAAGLGSPASAAASAMTLSSVTGPSAGGNSITGTVAASALAFPAGTTPTVQFQYFGTGSTACSASARAVTQIAGSGTATTAGVLTAEPDTVLRISTTKIVFQVPSRAYPALDENGNPSAVNAGGLVLVGAQTSAKWNVCVYDSDSTVSSTLLATATYTLAARPAITAVLPASSPSGGGQTITVNGSGFSTVVTPTTGSIGGAALTNIKVASNGNSLTAVTGPRAAGSGLALTLNTPGGPVSSLDPDNNPATNDTPIPFAYSNGITITPNTAPVGTQANIEVKGAGFAGLTFAAGGTPTSSQAHVFLVKGAYDPAANRGVAECEVIVVVSDNELVCSLDLAADQLNPVDSTTVPATPIVNDAYILTVVANGATNAGPAADPTIVSSGAAFIVAPY